jgi:hypothetical protein
MSNETIKTITINPSSLPLYWDDVLQDWTVYHPDEKFTLKEQQSE